MTNEQDLPTPPVIPIQKNTSSEVGAMADILEEFPWRFDAKYAPAKMKVRSYALKGNFQRQISRLSEEAEANNRAYSALKSKASEIEAELLVFDDDEHLNRIEFDKKERLKERLEEIKPKLADLENKPRTSNEVIAEEGFLKVIAEWDLTDKGVPIPLTREGVLSLNSVVFNKLWEDLGDFLSPERRKKRKV